MHEIPDTPRQDPEFDTDNVTGPLFDESLISLIKGDIRMITMNGQQLVTVNERHYDRDNDLVHAECRDITGHRNTFTYTLDEDSMVTHAVALMVQRHGARDFT